MKLPKVYNTLKYALIHHLLIVLLCVSCVNFEPLHDPIGPLLEGIQNQNWTSTQTYFDQNNPLDSFPLYLALKEGAYFEGIKRIRRLDDHHVIEVDVRGGPDAENSNDRMRYTFWLTIPHFIEGDEAQEPGIISGWAPPSIATNEWIDSVDLTAPNRFTATSFRGVIKNKPL